MTAPELSVIIPTFNRLPKLMHTLAAVAAQLADAPPFEVIVVDDGSTDGTSAALAELRPRFPVELRAERQENAGASAARNRAIRAARALLLVSIDDDSSPRPGMLRAHREFHRAHPEPGRGAVGMVVAPSGIAPTVFTILGMTPFREVHGRDELPWTSHYTTNSSLKRDFVLQHGLFDEHLRWHEDVEIAERLRHHGLRLNFLPGAVTVHDHEVTEEEYFRIAARDGVNLVAWYRRSPQLVHELGELGLVGPPPFRRALRHRAADLGIDLLTVERATRIARWTAPRSPKVAAVLYAKLFQYARRRAVERTLAGGADTG